TSLQHQLTGAALNLARIDAHLTGTPRARTRTRHFAALRPADQTIDGAKKTQGPGINQRHRLESRGALRHTHHDHRTGHPM
ncbi:hypothetical protein ACGFYV_08290, partial [Streptomyces sp. NPDC048297]|uniref:hypothetical protein n=1 Tax=Streptomyces sp. NPDC048297 TaxID=3365531 RepID=UPI0037120206